MKIKRLTLHGFTVFKDAVFDFAPGVNVLIGENGTGKSHVLKLLYVLSTAARQFATQGPNGIASLPYLVTKSLTEVFQPDALANLVSDHRRQAIATFHGWEDGRQFAIKIASDGTVTSDADSEALAPMIDQALFVPPKEILSIFPGFLPAWLNRESAYDVTYPDLCIALELNPLRSGGAPDVLEPLERELGGKVVLKDGRFYIRHQAGDREMPLVAEGDRKLAMIARLVATGSIAANRCLLWDEPEANLNPKRARLMGDTIGRLAKAGVQVFLATHDYALMSELALKIDAGEMSHGSAAFFALHRGTVDQGVVVEHGGRLADLQENAVLDALSSLHEREEEAVYGSKQSAQ